jgi:CubicO group peptidase (beta-lactamase class C family)
MTAMKMKSLSLLFAAALLCAPAPPARALDDAAIAPQVRTDIDALFKRWDTTSLPGCTLGVAKDGRQVLSRAYGMADLEHGVANRPDSIIEAGSVSKQFTAAAVLLLAQQGKISLDDPVRKYIPEVPDYGTPITIQQLLSHTSGLRDWGSVCGIAGWPRTTRTYTHAHVLDIVSRQKSLNYPPGTAYSYTNSGYNLLAVLVSRVSGKSFADFTRESLFEPLGMTRTSWRDDYTRIVPDRAIGYSVAGSTVSLNMPFENVHGNGGLLTTVGDMLRWNENAVSNKVGGAALTKAQRQKSRLKDGSEISYASGIVITQWHGVPEVSHSGGTAGYRAWLAQYPAEKVSVAVLCNAGDAPAWTLGRQVADLVLGLKAELAPGVEIAATDLAAVAGLYRNRNTHMVSTVTLTEGALHVDGGPALVPLSKDAFRTQSGGTRFEVERSSAGAVTGLRAVASGEGTGYERVAKVEPTPAQLAAYAGEYTSDEAEVMLRVVVEGGKLVLLRRPDTKLPLTANYADGFDSDLGQLRFLRDARGRVNELSVSEDRVWDLRFKKLAAAQVKK